MKTYYFGDIEFGLFTVDGLTENPLAIIHRVNEVRDFATDEDAEEYFETASDSESFLGLDGTDSFGVQYEIVFKQHR